MDARTLIVERDACEPRRLGLVVLCAGALAATSGTAGEPYAGKTVPDLVRLLCAALLETLQAPEFLVDARQANLEVDPVSDEQLEQVIAELFGLNGSVVSRLRELLR